jgi:hypothetical protein
MIIILITLLLSKYLILKIFIDMNDDHHLNATTMYFIKEYVEKIYADSSDSSDFSD